MGGNLSIISQGLVIGHCPLKKFAFCTSITFAQCSPRTAQAGCGRGQFMHVVCICITNSASNSIL